MGVSSGIAADMHHARVHALIGGFHRFNASDEVLDCTAGKLRDFGVDNLMGGHCTGIETVYRFRTDLGLDRAHAVVGAVGASLEPRTTLLSVMPSIISKEEGAFPS